MKSKMIETFTRRCTSHVVPAIEPDAAKLRMNLGKGSPTFMPHKTLRALFSPTKTASITVGY